MSSNVEYRWCGGGGEVHPRCHSASNKAHNVGQVQQYSRGPDIPQP